jgi:SAM-dependent methyltransferase
MLMLYGRHYFSRQRAIADLIPAGASVLDVCCGPGSLYTRHLRAKTIDYTGLDSNKRFVDAVNRAGGRGLLWDLTDQKPLPRADFVVMHASLYHFLPDASGVVRRMLEAARQKLILAEPVKNLASSESPVLAFLGRRLTDAGRGAEQLRFTERSLDELMSSFAPRIERSFFVPGGREKVFVMDALARP